MNKGLMMKKTILATLVGIATACSSQVFAQEASTVAASAVPAIASAPETPSAPVVSPAVERPTLTSNLSSDQLKLLKDYIQNNEQLNELAHKERVLDYEARLSKLELEKLKAEQERDELLVKVVAPAIAEKKEQSTKSTGEQSASHSGDDDEANPLDQVFITKVYGLDNNLRVTVYYKGTILNMRAGDEVADGIRLVRVFDNAAIFAKGKETRRVSMTTGKNAMSKAFDSDRDEQDSMQNMATPIGFPGGM
jgi:hypothetical protein